MHENAYEIPNPTNELSRTHSGQNDYFLTHKNPQHFWCQNEFSRVLTLKNLIFVPFCENCEKFTKNGAKILKINFFGHEICIKSGFCNEPKIVNIAHCVA